MSSYTLNINKAMFRRIRKTVSIIILVAFISTSVKSPAYAQVATADQLPWMPKPGVMVHLSSEFAPSQLTAISIHPDNALQFDFLINKGDQSLAGDQKKEEYKKLVKYFLASLTIPDDDQWVNLSPYEKNRIIQDNFGKTEMGRDLLAQDYLLKQITSSLIYPEEGLGKQFWNRIYQRAWNEYHTTNIPVNTFNKVWIVPDEAMVYESGNTVYILRSHLRVMLEEDYLSMSKHTAIINPQPTQSKEVNKIGSQVIREIVLPELEKEVNTGKNFANLRQMYSGMVLATWYKKDLKESLLGKVYADRAKVKGVDQNPRNNEAIYQQYLKAFKKGAFNYIKEDVDKYTHETIPRKYFSGGFERDKAMLIDYQDSVNPEKYPSGVPAGAIVVIKPTDLKAMSADERERILAGLKQVGDLVTVQFDPAGLPNARNISGQTGGQTLFANNLSEKEISAGQQIITALKKGAVVEAQGTGSKVTFNITQQVIKSVRNSLAVVNPKIQLTEGNLNAQELADIQTRLSTAVGSPVTVVKDGKSFSFKSALPVEKARQQIDAAMGTTFVEIFFGIVGGVSSGAAIVSFMNHNPAAGWSLVAFVLFFSSVYFYIKEEKEKTKIEFIKHNVRVVPMANGQEGSTITLSRPKEKTTTDEEWDNIMDSLIEAVGVFDKYAVTKGENELVITTNETKADVDEEIADMAMVGIPAGQQIITALKEGAVVEAKGAGSKITFNITPQVRTAVRKLLAIINPKIQLTKGGNLSAEELADIQTGLSTAVESPVTVARDGQSFSFESDLSASDMKQRFDAAMSSDQEGKVLLTVTGIFGAMALIGAFLNNEFVFAFGGMEMLVSAIVGFHFFLSLSPYREYIKQNRVIEERGLQGRVVTLKRPKVSDKGWASMGDDLIKALGVTGNKEFQITRDEKEIRIETSMSKVDLDKKISDMAMTTTLNPKQIGKSDKAALSTKNPWVQGGIDFNSANLNLQIKRDGRGVPLPLAQQDMAQLNSIGGFVPEILEIKPVVDFPIISELQQKLQTTSAVASVS